MFQSKYKSCVSQIAALLKLHFSDLWPSFLYRLLYLIVLSLEAGGLEVIKGWFKSSHHMFWFYTNNSHILSLNAESFSAPWHFWLGWKCSGLCLFYKNIVVYIGLYNIFHAELCVWNLWHGKDDTASSFHNGPMWIYMSSEYEWSGLCLDKWCILAGMAPFCGVFVGYL